MIPTHSFFFLQLLWSPILFVSAGRPRIDTSYTASINNRRGGTVPRASPDNTVVVESELSHCLIVPKWPETPIGESEQPGGTTTYCSPSARSDESQGELPYDFWTDLAFVEGTGDRGGRFVQITGCINPKRLDRLDPYDEGGQYDSSGGEDGSGNPAGSVCSGYNHYIELIEPAGYRACIRCCEDEDDCPLHNDTEGCPNVIPGEYFTCD